VQGGDRRRLFAQGCRVGVVHHSDPAPLREQSPAVAALHARLKHEFDPTGRLNPGMDVLVV